MEDMIPIIIPSYEPSDGMLKIIEEIKRTTRAAVIIVDDGSGLRYRDVFDKAERAGCSVIRHAVNLGKGRALKSAFNYLLNEYPDAIGAVTCDSDGQHSIDDILRCMKMLEDNPGSLILGCRNFRGHGIPWRSKLGNEFTKIALRYLCGIKVGDTQTGLRGIPVALLRVFISTPGERFEYETNMLLECKDTVSIIEIPISTIYDSKTDHSTHFNPVRDSIMIYKVILSYSLTSFLSTMVDYVVFTIIYGLGGSIWICTAAGRTLAAIINFTLNRNAVFKSHGRFYVQALKYILLVFCSGIMSASIISVTSKYLPIEVVAIKAVVEIMLFFFNYYIQRTFIFGDKKGENKGNWN